MYAGTMTVMLRMLGIPSRVGEGFTEGTRNVSRGTYVVTDRDAHAWVEVWFPKFGWMPFEPTPSRELPFDYSTTSKNFSDAATKSLARRRRVRLGAPRAAGEAGRHAEPRRGRARSAAAAARARAAAASARSWARTGTRASSRGCC